MDDETVEELMERAERIIEEGERLPPPDEEELEQDA
jgi:sulfur transfer protein SufE